jgi:hypothetical protein
LFELNDLVEMRIDFQEDNAKIECRQYAAGRRYFDAAYRFALGNEN